MGKLLDELKRRNVIRVAVAYAVASWLLLQIADLVLDNMPAPAWVMQVFMLALALGFTPEGLKRSIYPAAFDPYRSDARFIELENEVIRRAEEERSKLGTI